MSSSERTPTPRAQPVPGPSRQYSSFRRPATRSQSPVIVAEPDSTVPEEQFDNASWSFVLTNVTRCLQEMIEGHSYEEVMERYNPLLDHYFTEPIKSNELGRAIGLATSSDPRLGHYGVDLSLNYMSSEIGTNFFLGLVDGLLCNPQRSGYGPTLVAMYTRLLDHWGHRFGVLKEALVSYLSTPSDTSAKTDYLPLFLEAADGLAEDDIKGFKRLLGVYEIPQDLVRPEDYERLEDLRTRYRKK